MQFLISSFLLFSFVCFVFTFVFVFSFPVRRLENNTEFGERLAEKAMPQVKYIEVELEDESESCLRL